ncbi:DUF4062 domain-containing protein [Mycobacteroides abscessus]|uniref:DUF4062 domain-containing protein n=1 Tax=Mycobacteroides abscessus TaxID=36809 RepID=UPI000C259348|nr:DUF4062 domain-containing protein [Mycobacteroides abscessus]RIR68165.1 DUF4062 domain-containing protein [Mycobacteroides abscessus]
MFHVDRRYQIFVSSTYQDLTEERKAVIEAILNLRHLPAGMEMFPAANADQMTLIKRMIDESDYYLVVVAGRYGSVDASGISYTEQEYDYAVKTGKPILGFVHGDPDAIQQGKTDQDDKARKRLNKFRKKVQSKIIRQFTSPAELGGCVTTSLVHIIDSDPGIGWVRGDRAMTIEMEREFIELRERLAKTERERDAARQNMIEDPSQLAQGDDKIQIPLKTSKLQPKISTSTHQVETTWDELFAAIGAKMVGEASIRALMTEAGLYLASKVPEINPEDLVTEGYGHGPRTGGIASGDWDKIQLQYQALGLVELGKRKRETSDYSTYLRLTDRGQQHLIHLRAIRREPTETT